MAIEVVVSLDPKDREALERCTAAFAKAVDQLESAQQSMEAARAQLRDTAQALSDLLSKTAK